MPSVHALLAAHAADELEELAEQDEDRDQLVTLARLLVAVAEHEAGDWRRGGACRGVHPDLFHTRSKASAALELCQRCPVLSACRTWALGLPQEVDRAGVAGGMEAEERRLWRRSSAA